MRKRSKIMRKRQKKKTIHLLSGNISFPSRLKHAKLGCLLLVQLGAVLEDQKDQNTLSEDFWLSKACADMWHTWNKVAVTFSSNLLGSRRISVCNPVLGEFSSMDKGTGGVRPCVPTSCHTNIYPSQTGLIVLEIRQHHTSMAVQM